MLVSTQRMTLWPPSDSPSRDSCSTTSRLMLTWGFTSPTAGASSPQPFGLAKLHDETSSKEGFVSTGAEPPSGWEPDGSMW